MSSLFKLRNLLLLLALGLAIVLIAEVMSRYRPVVNVPVSTAALPAGVDLALQQLDYTHTDGGIARWRLVASRAEHQAASKILQVKDLQLVFFDERGDEQLSLKAGSGTISSDYTAVEVRDEVELIHRNGYTLRTSSLNYRQADATIRTDAPIRLTGHDVAMDGVGLRIDLNKRRLHVPARVRAVLSRTPS